jgi:hypothetical protein
MRGVVRLLVASIRVIYMTVPVGAVLGFLLFGSSGKAAAMNSENDAKGDVGAI